MLKLHHSVTGNNWSRYFDDYDNNPTDAFAVKNTASMINSGGSTTNYTFDDCGNMLTEGSSRHFEWSYGDVLRAYRTQSGTSEPTVFTHYLYDAGGVRLKKITRNISGDPTVSVYIDGAFDHSYKVNATTGTRSYEHHEIHVMDDRIRIANLRIGTPFPGDNAPAVRYYLEDHLGNCSFTLETSGALFSREEYFPFGETSFGSFAKKRYRFCGKERDEESGLYYYGARYYAAWTCRFVNLDPLAGKYPFYTPYQYAANKPLIGIDLDGLENPNDNSQGKNNSNRNEIESTKASIIPKPGVYSFNSPYISKQVLDQVACAKDKNEIFQIILENYQKWEGKKMPDSKTETGLPVDYIRDKYGEYAVENNYNWDNLNNNTYIIWFRILETPEKYTLDSKVGYIQLNSNMSFDELIFIPKELEYTSTPGGRADLASDKAEWTTEKTAEGGRPGYNYKPSTQPEGNPNWNYEKDLLYYKNTGRESFIDLENINEWGFEELSDLDISDWDLTENYFSFPSIYKIPYRANVVNEKQWTELFKNPNNKVFYDRNKTYFDNKGLHFYGN